MLPAEIQMEMNAAIAGEFMALSYKPPPSDPKALLDRVDLELETFSEVAKERNISLEQ